MAIGLVITKHAPADCPAHSDDANEVNIEYLNKKAELLAKHGVKEVGAWVVHSEHFIVQVPEAPNLEAMLALSMEPENMNMMNWNPLNSNRQ
jgi:hypothetical protein